MRPAVNGPEMPCRRRFEPRWRAGLGAAGCGPHLTSSTGGLIIRARVLELQTRWRACDEATTAVACSGLQPLTPPQYCYRPSPHASAHHKPYSLLAEDFRQGLLKSCASPAASPGSLDRSHSAQKCFSSHLAILDSMAEARMGLADCALRHVWK